MDLGRFLAHLDLLLAKADGLVPQPLGQHLMEDLLGAYGDSAGRPFDGALVGRVDAFRRVALAISALHACRQLKERRLDLTLRLLRHQPDHPDDDNWPMSKRLVDKYIAAEHRDAFFSNMRTEHRLVFELRPDVLRAIDMRVYRGIA